MVHKAAVLLLAIAFLCLALLGNTARGDTPPSPKEMGKGVDPEQGTAIEVSQLIDVLAQKGLLTAQEKTMLQRGKMPPVSRIPSASLPGVVSTP